MNIDEAIFLVKNSTFLKVAHATEEIFNQFLFDKSFDFLTLKIEKFNRFNLFYNYYLISYEEKGETFPIISLSESELIKVAKILKLEAFI